MPRRKRKTRTRTKTKVRYRTRVVRVRGKSRSFLGRLKTPLIGAILTIAAKFGIRKFMPNAPPMIEYAAPLGVALYRKSLLPGVIAMIAGDLMTDFLTPGGYVNAPWIKTSIRGYEIG